MRWTVLSVCLVAAGCADRGPDSPTSPTGDMPAAGANRVAGADGRRGTELPFRGSFTSRGGSEANCPPTCPPTSLRITNAHVGEATHLGRFTAASVDVVNIATATGGGTFDFTAANGDQLFTTTAGGEDAFVPPNVSHVTLVATIVGGTGRFAGASGMVTIRMQTTIDFATATGSGSGSFDGYLALAD